MFKRANKVTALVLAAASVMSVVPAMASTRLGVKDGHIKGEAFAYDNGKYIYEGYRTNSDDNGIYYNDGSTDKEKQNEDLKDYELTSKYGTKYAYAKDGNDQYLVDLTTGKVVDSETPEDKADEVKSKLRSALKKTDRYALTGSWDTVDLGDQYAGTIKSRDGYNLNIFGSQFGDVWYQYTAKGDKNNGTNTGSTVGNVDTAAKFTIQLPSTVPTTGTYKVGNGAFLTYPATTTKAEFAQKVVAALVGDPDFAYNVTTDTGVFDVTTIKYDATLNQITGTAKKTGHVDATVALSYYTVVDGLGAGETTTGAAAGLALDKVIKAEGTRLQVDVKAARDAVAVIKDSDPATYAAYTARLNAIAVIGDEAPLGATTVQAVNTLVANPAIATLSTYTDAGITGVSADGSVSGTISVAVANAALKTAIANGKLGDSVSDAFARQKAIQAIITNEISKTQSSTKAVLYLVDGKVASNGSIGLRGSYTGFVNESAKYIDASATANMYIYSQAAKKTVKVKEFDKANQDYNITVTLENLYALDQDKDYIYALAKVAVSETGYAVNEQYFIQKISKAQGDTKDGAYLPKSVDSYQLDNNTIYDCGDSKVAYNFLVNGTEDGFTFENIRVKDGNLYITGAKDDNSDHDKVKVFKIVLKKDKIDTLIGDKQKDVDVYIAKKDGDSDIDIREGSLKDGKPIAYDVNGNTWVIAKGTITKFDGTEKKEMFTTDRSFDHLDVYDDKNLLAWDTENEVYTTVQEGTKKTQDESTAVAPVVVTGWVKGTDGTWTYNDAAGNKVVSKWLNLGGAWYYLKADGIMATGWYNDNGTWYYLNPSSGAMQTGWLNDNGTWYYLAGSGAMLKDTTVDGYQLGSSGAWIK
ncbi:N-acetylmuramoyl-L-alanine amidase family protein [Clostridium sp. C2-6-12]|uniref:N-acetylmuramoyl-L-alanine amidase family protein n=1 Tax=Clostridium sp. C2-6-12 TaxID=2698832 RepID=UPI0013690D6D|nr:N-acetylmuramoyl-L-alanine amidase family protein [Clostridium sp. C2-6-12]